MWSVIIMLTLCFILLFFLCRLLMNIYFTTLIKNNRHRNERKKNQSFWEWLTYKRFWDIIPKKELAYIIYWGNFVLYFILIVVTVIATQVNILEQIRELLCSIQFIVVGGSLGLRFTTLGGNRK